MYIVWIPPFLKGGESEFELSLKGGDLKNFQKGRDVNMVQGQVILTFRNYITFCKIMLDI